MIRIRYDDMADSEVFFYVSDNTSEEQLIRSMENYINSAYQIRNTSHVATVEEQAYMAMDCFMMGYYLGADKDLGDIVRYGNFMFDEVPSEMITLINSWYLLNKQVKQDKSK